MGALQAATAPFQALSSTLAFNEEKRVGLLNMSELERSSRIEAVNATQALAEGTLAAGQYRQRGQATADAQAAGFAAAGLDANSGTAAGLQSAAKLYSDLDAATVMANARARAMGAKEASRRYGVEADLLRQKYLTGGFFGGTADDQFGLQLLGQGFSSALSAGGGSFGFSPGGK